jgi:uncharacterized repeat protein (TIGR01451 family)/MYXO-CTERM domain-containing protein
MLRRSFVPRSVALLIAGAGVLAALPAWADAPTIRWRGDLRGDVRIFGNTLAYDCHSPVPASPAAVSCDGDADEADTAPDIYWHDNTADKSVTPSNARTSATLELPTGAKVVYARLYWAALKVGNQPDTEVDLDWEFAGTDIKKVTADATNVVPHPYIAQHPDWYFYQSSGEVTDYVSKWSAGDFRVTGVESINLADQDIDVTFSAWTLVVFYENQADDLRNLALFDGLFWVDPAIAASASVQLTNILVPPNGYSAKMAAFVYEGDGHADYSGDSFAMNGKNASNALNPADNFFNSSRTDMGNPVSGWADVPALSGQPDTMSGYDLDMIDVTLSVNAGDTEATVTASSTYDKFYIGGFVTSLTNQAPDFNNLIKEAKDVNGGAVVPGDIIEYTISGKNAGNDDATGVVLTDTIEAGLEFVSGSLEIVEGGTVGLKTDAAGDDQAEYVAAGKKAVWRLGTGATATAGGTVSQGAPIKVRFKAKVVAQSGSVANEGILEALGASGGVKKEWHTDGDPNAVGSQKTIITINECDADKDCPPAKPHCDPDKHICGPCVTDADCLDPNKPACQSSGVCGECSATNKNKCNTPAKPECDVAKGVCVFCIPAPDPSPACKGATDGPLCVANGGGVFCGCAKDTDCGNQTSGKVCDLAVQKCVDGCRGKNGNGCPTEKQCTSKDTTIGKCVVPGPDAGAGGQGGEGGEGGGPIFPAKSGDDGGCACSVPGNRDVGIAGLVLAMLGFGSALTRRRRRN